MSDLRQSKKAEGGLAKDCMGVLGLSQIDLRPRATFAFAADIITGLVGCLHSCQETTKLTELRISPARMLAGPKVAYENTAN